ARREGGDTVLSRPPGGHGPQRAGAPLPASGGAAYSLAISAVGARIRADQFLRLRERRRARFHLARRPLADRPGLAASSPPARVRRSTALPDRRGARVARALRSRPGRGYRRPRRSLLGR